VCVCVNSGEHVPETLEYGISSFVFRAQRPFHPGRLRALIMDAEGGLKDVVRSKGDCWVANAACYEHMMQWAQAGAVFQFTYYGLWWATGVCVCVCVCVMCTCFACVVSRALRALFTWWCTLARLRLLLRAVPRAMWPPSTKKAMKADGAWDDVHGDRKQEIVFIGVRCLPALALLWLSVCRLTVHLGLQTCVPCLFEGKSWC
jgi:G3E family GTPase